MLFITNTWIHLNSLCVGDGAVGLNIAYPLLSETAYLAWWQCRLSLLHRGWKAGDLKTSNLYSAPCSSKTILNFEAAKTKSE